jgi:hypothetical protein
MHGWHATTGTGTTIAIHEHGRAVGGRLLAHYVLDLLASMAAVLALGWFIEASASNAYLRDAIVTQNEIYVAICRFTPHNLALSYAHTVDEMTRGLVFGYQTGESLTDVLQQALATVTQFLLDLVLAVPRTIIDLYHETSGTAAWIVLAGFAVAVGSVFAAMLATRASVFRLLVAAALTPFAISVLFVALQGFMIAMLDTFYWFTSLAPFTVACPVLCTAYWMAFPNAERGITASVAYAILRVLEPKR